MVRRGFEALFGLRVLVPEGVGASLLPRCCLIFWEGMTEVLRYWQETEVNAAETLSHMGTAMSLSLSI